MKYRAWWQFVTGVAFGVWIDSIAAGIWMLGMTRLAAHLVDRVDG